MLYPADAMLSPDTRPPSTTSYRANTLIIPESVLRDSDTVARIDKALAGVGLALKVPAPIGESLPTLRPWSQELGDLPRAAVLRVREGAPPTSVDAWVALQALRSASRCTGSASGHKGASGAVAAGTAGTAGTAGAAGDDPLPSDVVSRISLDHLLFASATNLPSPASDGHAGGGGGEVCLMFSADSRIPVKVLSSAPRRTPLKEPGVSRRPVIAVLDSGIRRHPWLEARPGDADPFVTTDDAVQDAIHDEETRVRAESGLDIPILVGHEDVPDEAGSAWGLLDTHIGHGTFIAGVIRQAAPDAQVRMIRVMHADGVVQASVLLLALAALSAQTTKALNGGEAGKEDAVIDAVSLSLGYYDEYPHDSEYTNHLAELIDQLTELGIAVFASAGNDGNWHPCFPAALAERPSAGLPVVSVGALNPNGTKAMFSNDGPWVTAWASGANVISTYPVDLDGSEQPLIAPRLPGSHVVGHRETVDPDGFRSGFAVWSGTSFSAPLVAAAYATALLEQPTPRSTDVDRQSRRQRAEAARKWTVEAFPPPAPKPKQSAAEPGRTDAE